MFHFPRHFCCKLLFSGQIRHVDLPFCGKSKTKKPLSQHKLIHSLTKIHPHDKLIIFFQMSTFSGVTWWVRT